MCIYHGLSTHVINLCYVDTVSDLNAYKLIILIQGSVNVFYIFCNCDTCFVTMNIVMYMSIIIDNMFLINSKYKALKGDGF